MTGPVARPRPRLTKALGDCLFWCDRFCPLGIDFGSPSMRSLLFMIPSVLALALPARLHAAATAEADAHRAQVAAANADAVEGLRRDVLSSSLTSDMTVEQFVQRTDSRDALDRA